MPTQADKHFDATDSAHFLQVAQAARMTVPALLRTEQVHVDVHTTLSYVYDMRTGEFQPRHKGGA